MPFNHKANLASCLESLRKSMVPRWDKYFANKTTNTGFDFYHSDSPAVHFAWIYFHTDLIEDTLSQKSTIFSDLFLDQNIAKGTPNPRVEFSLPKLLV